jgi:hypothetical protein
VSPDFKAQNFVWSAYNRGTIQYLVQSNPATLRPVPQPHLSFHPPHWFRLRGNGGKKLFEGIGDLLLMLQPVARLALMSISPRSWSASLSAVRGASPRSISVSSAVSSATGVPWPSGSPGSIPTLQKNRVRLQFPNGAYNAPYTSYDIKYRMGQERRCRMNYILTQHARDALLKRKISIAWLELVLQFPMRTDPDENDAELEH